MEEQIVVSEPAGSEADRSAGTKSTLQPPAFETGEFDRLLAKDPSLVELKSAVRELTGEDSVPDEVQEVDEVQKEDEVDGEVEDDESRSFLRSMDPKLIRRTAAPLFRLKR